MIVWVQESWSHVLHHSVVRLLDYYSSGSIPNILEGRPNNSNIQLIHKALGFEVNVFYLFESDL